jgi:lysophospholipase L1-like esterase
MWRSTFGVMMIAVVSTSSAATTHGDLRYLALGDSYTIGESVPDAQRWPVQLATALRADGMAIAEPQIIAKTGWTTDELAAAIDAARPQGPYDLVTLLIGVNNQYRGRDADEYRAQFAALLTRAVGFAGDRAARVIVVSIPDWGVTPFAAKSGRDIARIASELDTFNAIARQESEKRGAAFVDITGISRDPEGATKSAWLADDGLHPGGAQYTAWAQAIEPVARERLQSR